MCGIVLPSLIILGMLPVAVQIGYADGAFSFKGYVFFLPFDFGRKKKASRVERGVAARLQNLLSRPKGKIILKNAYTTLKRLMPRVWIPYLQLHILAAGRDPAHAALAYGAAGTLMQGLQTRFSSRVREMDLRVEVDFLRDRPEITARVHASLRLYQALWSAAGFARGFWRDYRHQKRSMSIHDESATG